MVNIILMDQEFDRVKEEVGLVEINTASSREHLGKIEGMIRIIKERCQEIVSTIPFKNLPKKFFTNLIYYVVMFFNCMADVQGVSEHLSPREIVTGWSLDPKKNFKAQLGSNIETCKNRVVTNTQHP